MPANVLYLPGCLGSGLGIDLGAGVPPWLVWPDPAVILAGGMALLDLDADGVSPGPITSGERVVPTGIFGPVYGPMALAIQQAGYRVQVQPFDWRLSLFVSAPPVLAAALAAFGDEPFQIVAHSQGGLLALAVFSLMVEQGRDAQLTRLITLGTPYFGSLEPTRMWCYLPYVYRALVIANGWKGYLPGSPGQAALSEVLASHPCWYELTAFRDNGPLAQERPEQAAAIYQFGSFAGSNPYLSQERMDSAAVVQNNLVGSAPSGRLATIVGIGTSTPYQLAGPLPTRRASGYLYTDQGDGLVTLAQGSYPGVSAIIVGLDHALMMLAGSVASIVLGLLAEPAPAARLPRPALTGPIVHP